MGKKLAKSAVERNRVRRRVREAARTVEGLAGVDVVLTARPRALKASTAEMEAALRLLLLRAGLTGVER